MMSIKVTIVPDFDSYTTNLTLGDLGLTQEDWDKMTQEEKENHLSMAASEEANNNLTWQCKEFDEAN